MRPGLVTVLSLPLGPSRAGLQAGEQLDRGEVGQPSARALVRAEGHLKREEQGEHEDEREGELGLVRARVRVRVRARVRVRG